MGRGKKGEEGGTRCKERQRGGGGTRWEGDRGKVGGIRWRGGHKGGSSRWEGNGGEAQGRRGTAGRGRGHKVGGRQKGGGGTRQNVCKTVYLEIAITLYRSFLFLMAVEYSVCLRTLGCSAMSLAFSLLPVVGYIHTTMFVYPLASRTQ